MGSSDTRTVSYDNLPNNRKAAILLLGLDQDSASLILKPLEPKAIEEVTRELAALGGLPGPKQVEVVKRVANMEQTNPEVISEVERGLEARLSNMLTQSFEKIGGIETVAEMLNLVDRTTEKGIMEGLETEDPDLVEQIRRLMFVFEDILLVNDKGIQACLRKSTKKNCRSPSRPPATSQSRRISRNMPG